MIKPLVKINDALVIIPYSRIEHLCGIEPLFKKFGLPISFPLVLPHNPLDCAYALSNPSVVLNMQCAIEPLGRIEHPMRY